LRFVRLRSWTGLFVLVSALVVSTPSVALGEIKEEARWSIEFGDVSLSEAFDQLTKVTGIRIFTTVPIPYRIHPKRYTNQRIEQILKDMLKNVNHAAVWHYSEGGIESIGVLAFDRQQQVASRSPVVSAGKVGTMPRPLPRFSRPKRPYPSRQVGGSEEDEGVKEPPVEPEETGGSEPDDRDEELEQSSTDDTSGPDSSDARLESSAGSSSGEEGLPKDQQDEDKE
jgi:hypothetical protein